MARPKLRALKPASSRPAGTLRARLAGVTLNRRDQENVARLAELVLDARGALFLDPKTAVSLALEIARRVAEAGEVARWHVPVEEPVAAPALTQGDPTDIRAFLGRYARSAAPPCPPPGGAQKAVGREDAEPVADLFG